MLLVAFRAEELHVLFLPRCNHIRWASLALHSPSKSVRVVHDQRQADSSAALAPLSRDYVQPLSLLVAPSFAQLMSGSGWMSLALTTLLNTEHR
jgi:hypothetical protein